MTTVLRPLQINSCFEGGNIHVVNQDDPKNIQLEIKKDHQSDFYQWFYFRLSGALEKRCTLNITNAGGAAYPEGFDNYEAVISYDRKNWTRAATQFDGQTLTIKLTPSTNVVYIAYFAPYAMERHADLLGEISYKNYDVDILQLGETLDGRPLDVVKIGHPLEGKKTAWIIARQHPGETMASWWAEGFLQRMIRESDPIARMLLKEWTFYVVPNMNPDGSYRGHLRTNAAGINLNREWDNPSMEKSPEVFLVREMMEQTGVDFFLDVHGDEALPHNFIASSEGVTNWSPARQALLDSYKDALVQSSPDFQTKVGYEVSPPGQANLSKATNYVAFRHECLAMTLEMPFKDTLENLDEVHGWSPKRCKHLAEACIQALHIVSSKLG